MQLIDKEENSLQLANFFHDRLDALFELAAVLRARHHEGQIQRDDLLIAQNLRDVARSNFLGEAFHNRSFADARFPNEHGVIFGPAAEDLDDALNLIFSADDRIHFSLAGEFG